MRRMLTLVFLISVVAVNRLQSMPDMSRGLDSCIIFAHNWTSSFGPESSSCLARFEGHGELLITMVDSGGLIRELLDEDLISVYYRIERSQLSGFIRQINQIRWSTMGFLATYWPRKYLLPVLVAVANVSEDLRIALVDLIEPYRITTASENPVL